MRINPFIFGILTLAIFMGTILGFQAAGIWSVSGKVTADGQAIQPSSADVNSIKGWMTMEQITTTYNVPLEELRAHFDLPADTPASTAIKDLESDLFSVTNLRTWLQARQDGNSGAPVENSPTPVDPTATPEPVTVQPVVEPPAPTATVHAAPARTITGKTTFQELLDWGVSKEAIQKVVGGSLPPGTTVIKDYVTGKGLEFSSIKTGLQAEVDQVQ
jgi:hypothetical protein